MTKLTFFPIGNADTCLVELQDGRRMLVDFADMADKDDEADKRCDLSALLTEDFEEAEVDDYHVVAFTHLDDDHCHRASEYFWLDHAKAYQSDDRKKIATLWVPAGVITEDGLTGDARAIRQEARHRLRQGKGIVVFSRPERLKDWLEDNDLTVEDRADCFVDAGQLVPGLTIAEDAVEAFAHSPHATRTDDNGLEDRNGDSLVFQMRFREGSYDTDVLFAADIDHEVLAEIVDITKHHKNDDRLHWNIYKLPHHCSYTAIGPDKGTNKTVATAQVQWLCKEQGETAGYVVSSSNPIPKKGSEADMDVQPPHRQAANYYREDVVESDHLLVTMEHPKSSAPKPIELDIGPKGASKKALGVPAAAALVGGASAPRAGNGR
ncbi:ComEC/Rec2 family competence protein [Roseivivax sp.]